MGGCSYSKPKLKVGIQVIIARSHVTGQQRKETSHLKCTRPFREKLFHQVPILKHPSNSSLCIKRLDNKVQPEIV